MKKFLLLAFLITPYVLFCQETDSLLISKLQIGDTLVVDIVCKTCRTKYGDRLLIVKTNNAFKGLILKDFYILHYLDGKLLNERELQNSLISYRDYIAIDLSTDVLRKIYTLENQILMKQPIPNPDGIIAGDWFEVSFSLKNKIHCYEQKGCPELIDIENLIK